MGDRTKEIRELPRRPTGINFNEINSQENVTILQKLAPQFGVTVTILQKEGELYTHHLGEDRGRVKKALTATVPKNASYINIR